jgi:peptidoglycan hydrolase-like protein with peptidoglycan-binding domain
MRFYEIKKLIEAEDVQGYYTVGDSHAVEVARQGGKAWTNLAVGGSSSKGSHSIIRKMLSGISQVPKGSVVLISLGANDTANAMTGGKPSRTPESIAADVSAVVEKVRAQSPSKIFFLLFPNGPGRGSKGAELYGGEFQDKVRDAIKGSVSGVTIIDINGKPLVDGVHAGGATYKEVAMEVMGSAKPAVSDKSDAAKTVDGLKAGPPYPPEQYAAIKKLQKELEAIGYSVGSTGIDGKYGPRTTRAVRAFKADYKVDGDGLSISAEGLTKLSNVATGKEKKVEKPTDTGNTAGSRYVSKADPDAQSPGYPPGMTVGAMEQIISREATARNMDPKTAIKIFRAEGATNYQSQIPKTGKGSYAGKEASFGPYQLYIGGGMGNQYQQATGRDLTKDNTADGITNQIRFALDQATKVGWSPWMGRGPAGVAANAGLEGSKAINNWS